MIFNLKIVKVCSEYCDYLRQFDNRVVYNKNEKELRKLYNRLQQVQLYLAYDKENKDKLLLRSKLVEEIKRLEE